MRWANRNDDQKVEILVSLLTPEPEAAALFDSEKLRCYLGIGAE
ncbi:MAG: hypothetical protein ACAI44_03395 [Candidatus Sericytochromatia bacterium]